MTKRTSWRATSRAVHNPTMPPTKKNSVVASDTDATSHPRSRLNAFRYTASP